jgi:hypothetical protein
MGKKNKGFPFMGERAGRLHAPAKLKRQPLTSKRLDFYLISFFALCQEPELPHQKSNPKAAVPHYDGGNPSGGQ